MKKSISLKTAITFLILLLCGTSVFSQTKTRFELEPGEAPPEWFFEEHSNYNYVKEVFLKYYGTNKAEWPEVIRVSDRIFMQYKEFAALQKKPDDFWNNTYLFFCNELKYDKLKKLEGRREVDYLDIFNTHHNRYRNYYQLLNDYYNENMGSWGSYKNRPVFKMDESVKNSYYDAEKEDGILPFIFYIYTKECPPGLLPWYFEEVFPVIDALYRQDTKEGLIHILNSSVKHLNKLIDNYELSKALVFRDCLHKFITFYRAELISIPSIIANRTIGYKEIEAAQKIKQILRRKFMLEMEDLSTDLSHSIKVIDTKKMGRLNFPKLMEKDLGKDVIANGHLILDKEFIKEFGNKIENEEEVKPEHKLQFRANIELFEKNSESRLENLKKEIKNASLYKRVGQTLFYTSKETGLSKFTVFNENTFHSMTIELNLNKDYHQVWIRCYRRSWHISLPENISRKILQRYIDFAVESVSEVLNQKPVPIKIDGVDFKKPEIKYYAIKAESSSNEIKIDGKSVVEINARLYSYLADEESSSSPVSGKPLNFEIISTESLKPGKLSATSATTNKEGEISFNYIAPDQATIEELQPSNRISTSIKIKNDEFGVEDIIYISFISDQGSIWVEPAPGIHSNTGYVPPDKRYPALISANFFDTDQEPLINTEVVFTITEKNPVGKLRNDNGTEGTQIKAKTDQQGIASVQYFYAAKEQPKTKITETVEAKTAKMSIPLRAFVTTGFNIVIDDAASGYESSKEVNAGEEIPLKITVKDDWNEDLDMNEMLTYWGLGGNSGENKLFVKLEIEKQGYVPKYLTDFLASKNYQEPLYEELLYPKNIGGYKNLLYLSESSLKKRGFPIVRPLFSGINNYEIRVFLTDEKGKVVFESPSPRRYSFLSIPTDVPADAIAIWMASNPLGPHTPVSRFARLLLSTVTIGDVGFGGILSLADAASAINSGDAQALTEIFISEIKGQLFDDWSEIKYAKEFLPEYNLLAVVEEYTSYAASFINPDVEDQEIISQMEGKIFSAISEKLLESGKRLIVLTGKGKQKLFMKEPPKEKSGLARVLKENIKINMSGVDPKTKDLIDKIAGKIKKPGNEIPAKEGKFTNAGDLKTISLKNGNISVYIVPDDAEITSEEASEVKIF